MVLSDKEREEYLAACEALRVEAEASLTRMKQAERDFWCCQVVMGVVFLYALYRIIVN